MKNLLKVIAVLMAVLMFTACNNGGGTGGEPTDDGKLKIAYSVQSLDNEYFVTISNGVKEYAESLGYEVEITNGNQDIATQVSQVENFIEKGVDIIIISPVSDTGLEDAVKRATDAGITVIAANQNFGGSQAFVTIPEYSLGRALGDACGKYIAETWGDEPVDVLVLDYPDIEAIVPRGDGMREGVLAYAPNANIVQSISANTVEKGTNAMETAIQVYPNIQVVIGCNDAAALGAYSVIEAQHLAEGNDKFYVGGMDGTSQALDLIKQGTPYKATIDINAPGTGKILVDTALKVRESGPIAETIEIPLNVVTPENVDQFMQ
ncbi:MAG: sugar ABC transporter substrate-binding protein [Erysipelotrichaceae bacterium]|nr:sugar ABC transporter substrate-binding protein [Erysipelotrichaceae bacterium]MBR5755030.1 sugar ABC transporter substrate-binding protein [Erysipelotrichaceae bacterium]